MGVSDIDLLTGGRIWSQNLPDIEAVNERVFDDWREALRACLVDALTCT